MTRIRKKTGALSLAVLIVFVAPLLLPQRTAASQPASTYYPTGYNLLGTTAYVSGPTTDLQSDDGNYMTFRSFASQTSSQTLYAHQETATINGTSYYLQKLESADASGTILSAPMSSNGRQPLGKFVYPLSGVASIPASSWTLYYRAWHSSVPETVVTMSPTSWPDGSWAGKDRAQASDNQYAESATANAIQPYGGYGFSIPFLANIVKVEVGYEAYTEQDEKIGISVSWDGSSFPVEYVLPLGTSDPNTVTWIDFTDATSWTASKLSDANLLIRTRAVQVGSSMGKVRLDWIPVRVTYVILPIAHADIDVLICQSNGTIRQTIATNVASSGTLSTTAQTLSGTYSWSAYSVVNQTDYLEIDYFVDVTFPIFDIIGFLRIDDNILNIADQTRATGVMLPSEHTIEVEFTGSSDTGYWSKLVWTVVSAWTTDNVAVTLQLYNYTLGGYPTTVNGHIFYTSNATPNTDETKNQTITTNPAHFRDSVGDWKIKVRGVKSTATQFDSEAELIKLEATGDVAPPIWSNAGTNSTISAQPALFYVKWTDDVGLSGFIFGTNNTGAWKNDTWTPMSGNSNWSNVAKTLNSASGIVVLWRIWANDTSDNWNDTGTLSLMTLQPVLVTHDVAVISVTPSTTEIHVGQVVNVTVVVKNEGTVEETFNVTAYYNETSIGTKIVYDLAPNASTTLSFVWNTIGLTSDAAYTLKAEVTGVAEETDINDNTYTFGTVRVKAQTVSNPDNWLQILAYAIPLSLGFLSLLGGIIWKNRSTGSKEADFEYFNEMTDGGIPDSYSVMIMGEASSGKSTLCQQLVYTFLTRGKPCVYVTYDCFPDEIRKNMKDFNWDASVYEQEGTFTFIDAYSSVADVASREKSKIEDPFSLSDLGISMSAAFEEMNEKSVSAFLDSTASLFTHLEPAEVIKFLEDRSARIKGNNGVFFFTIGKGMVPSDLMRRLEETVDSIIELEIHKEKDKTIRKLCIRKMRRRRFHEACVQFNVKPPKGILFSLQKGRSKTI